MRFPLLLLPLLVAAWLLPLESLGQNAQSLSLATHNEKIKPSHVDALALDRIRKIVLHQGESTRALANLVQLTRNLDAETAAQLFSDLADDYLRQGKYNQAANFLQQLLNQHHAQPAARSGLLKLMQLYSSSEVNHTQQSASSASADGQAYCKYALHIANNTLQKNSILNNDPAVSFQRAATARGANRLQLSKSFLTRLKYGAKAGPWRARAKAESWLQDGRKGKPPMPVILCRHAAERPHLDGVLTDALWQSDQPVQLTYDDEFLYLALRYPKVASQTYEVDTRPRTHDADLSNHDHVRLRLDLDRDYATCFELSVDHRGWTADRCWHDASWNPQWFVAAGGDDFTWTIEAAIAWEKLTPSAPRSGQAWAVAWNRGLPTSKSQSPSEEASATGEPFSLLLFE